MISTDIILEALKIVGLGVLAFMAGLWWLWWKEGRSRRRYLDGQRDSEAGDQ